MDRRIALQSNTHTQNTFGEPVETWSTLATVWCEVVPMRVSEMYLASEERVLKSTIFRIRYRGDVNEKMRILYEGQAYRITGINEVGRNMGLEIMGELLE